MEVKIIDGKWYVVDDAGNQQSGPYASFTEATKAVNGAAQGATTATSTPAPSATPSATPTSKPTTYPANAERYRSLVEKYFKPEDVDKALYVINIESGGNPDIAGDGGHSIGLFQHNDNGLASGRSLEALKDPESNIKLAAEAVYGSQGWKPWGEGATYKGAPFGALGNHPYGGGSDAALQEAVAGGKIENLPPSQVAAAFKKGYISEAQYKAFLVGTLGQTR